MATVYQDTPPRFFPQPFQNNSVNAQGYYVTVTDGVTSIFRKGKNILGQEQIVNIGSIAKAGKFTNTGDASKEEIQYFTANARKTVNEQAVEVVRRGIGGSAGGGNAKINDILGTNLASNPTDPPPAPEPPAPDPQASEVVPTNISATISDNYVRTNYGTPENLRYPETLKLETQDCIQFKMFRYGSRSIDASTEEKALNLKLPDRNLTEITGTVTLPIQPSITDSNGVEWGGANLSPTDAYFASLARGAMEGEGSAADVIAGLAGRVSGDLKKALGNKDIKSAMLTYFTQEAVGIQGLLSRTAGGILNPNLELLFNGPTLRPFNFTFRLSPRSEKEAANVRRIIRFFKQGMSVKTSPTNIFLKAPNVFEIKYLTDGKDHPSLNRIKKCALLGCDVDYTPDGTYMTFNDESKTMTSYQLSLRFSELEPIYEDDYNQIDGVNPQDDPNSAKFGSGGIGY